MLTAVLTMASAYAANLLIEADRVTITGEQNLAVYEDPNTLTGNVVKRFFCKTCGSSIKSETPPATEAGKVVVKLGIVSRRAFPEIPKESNPRTDG